MPFVQGIDRDQTRVTSLDMLIGDECLARVIDVFVDSLDLAAMGFLRAEAAEEGRPAYDAGSLLKLYIYGHYEGIRSSRKLARTCEINMEICWLLHGMLPDYRTIARFRHDNVTRLKSVFRAFTERAFEVLKAGFISIDGSKFRASCSKDRNFTAAKLDDHIRRLANHIDEYMRQLEKEDAKEDVVLLACITMITGENKNRPIHCLPCSACENSCVCCAAAACCWIEQHPFTSNRFLNTDLKLQQELPYPARQQFGPLPDHGLHRRWGIHASAQIKQLVL